MCYPSLLILGRDMPVQGVHLGYVVSKSDIYKSSVQVTTSRLLVGRRTLVKGPRLWTDLSSIGRWYRLLLASYQ